MQEDLDFFFNNNASQLKIIKPYNTTRIKSQNLLTNKSLNGVKEEDFFDRSFAFDIYVLTTKNINPFSLERKTFDVKDREMINMFWEDCNDSSFCKRIFQPENFLYLDGKNVIYLQVAEIVMNYIEAADKNFDKLKRKLIENKKIFQFVYSSVYPEVYCFVQKRDAGMRNNFHLKFKELKNRKKYSQKSIEGYFFQAQNSPPPVGATQKKLISDEDFEEEKKLWKTKNKRKWKKKTKKKERRREIAAKNKERKRV